MRIADYPLHARKLRDFLRCSLCVAAGYQDLASGVFTMDAADSSARVPIGRRCHRTRIQDHDAGFLRPRCPLQSALAELPFHSRAIGLGRPAAKILYIKTSHANIVVEERRLCGVNWFAALGYCESFRKFAP